MVRKFAQEKDISFPILLDEDGTVSFQYNIRAHPKKFLISPEGKVIGVADGYREWDSEIVKSLIRQLISSKA